MKLQMITCAGSAKAGTKGNEKTSPFFQANLEYELWIPGHPVWLGTADGQHERHLRTSRRQRRPDSNSVAGRAYDRTDCAADYRQHERPDMGTPGETAALLPDRGVA